MGLGRNFAFQKKTRNWKRRAHGEANDFGGSAAYWNQQPVWRRRAGLFKLPLPLLRPISANREEKRTPPKADASAPPSPVADYSPLAFL
jgi:hypothetical protein